jgi:hypothetical protein
MGVVMEVHPDVDPRDPPEHERRREHECDPGWETLDSSLRRVQIKPEGAGVRDKAEEVEHHAVHVLGVCEDAAARCSCFRHAPVLRQKKVKITTSAAIVDARLHHGPKAIAPAMTTIARIGKKDRPRAFRARLLDQSVTIRGELWVKRA